MNHLRLDVQKLKSAKDMESNGFEYSFIKMNGISCCNQIDRQRFKNEASMRPFDSWKFWKLEFCLRAAYRRASCIRPKYLAKVRICGLLELDTSTIGDTSFQYNVLLLAVWIRYLRKCKKQLTNMISRESQTVLNEPKVNFDNTW